MKKYLFIAILLFASCQNDSDMIEFMSSISPSTGGVITIPTIAETEQIIFGNEAPYFSYRIGSIAEYNGVLCTSASAFFTEDNTDGKASDVVFKRSFDGGRTWQDRVVSGVNNGIIPSSRAYNEGSVVDKTTGRLYIQYVTIDNVDNLTANYPNNTYEVDNLIVYSDNWNDPNQTPTFSTPVSLLSKFKADLLTDAAINHVDYVLPGPGTGIQTANGNLVLFGYAFVNSVSSPTNWRLVPCLIVSDDNGATWTARSQPLGTFANESQGYELADNVIYINTRKGNGEARVERETADFGITYTTPPYAGNIIGLGSKGSVAKIPANGTTRTQDLHLYANITSNTPFRNSIQIDANLNRVNWADNVYALTDYESFGYVTLWYDGQYLHAMYESLDGNLDYVNLTEEIQNMYDAAFAVTP